MKNLFSFLLVLPTVFVWALTHQVDMVNFAFVPDTLTITQGDSVLWINQSALSFHTTTSGDTGVPNGIWDSGLMAPGDSFTFHFANVDNYSYYCTPHRLLGMIGLIVVAPAEIKEIGNNNPIENQARQNYPNPLNSFTHISYQLRKPGKVVVGIYDATGQPIRRFIRQHNTPGEYSIIWDGKDKNNQKVAAGIYFYQVNLDNETYTKKMLVNK